MGFCFRLGLQSKWESVVALVLALALARVRDGWVPPSLIKIPTIQIKTLLLRGQIEEREI